MKQIIIYEYILLYIVQLCNVHILLEMWWLIWRCGASLVASQTSEADVPGSNPASPISWGAAGSLCYTVKKQGRDGNLHLKQKNIKMAWKQFEFLCYKKRASSYLANENVLYHLANYSY